MLPEERRRGIYDVDVATPSSMDLAVIAHATRRARVLGTTAHPTANRVASSRAQLRAADLGGSPLTARAPGAPPPGADGSALFEQPQEFQ
ncbi:hypothetical protein [Herbidospora galbida]|uniref:hypothetical protein n=1 Tax=Herbidospora galbida TaxID=2575442 RepID=UPI001BAFE10F|nr:hypothetical protein [Herbidospora galbida]